jgi:hypothetical protein
MAETRAEKQNTKPSTVAPGDAPADTTDPKEMVSTVLPQPGPEAHAAGTVNSAVKIGDAPAGPTAPAVKDQRVEKYKATRPDGSEVTVTHNLDTGETSVS